jgi:glycyl-tRNA synthetase (class II)
LFPELYDHVPTVRPNGKIAIEVLTRDLPITIEQSCIVDHVVFLDRGHQADYSGPAVVHRCPKDRAREDWIVHAVLGTEDMRADQRRCYERLMRASLWQMQYSHLDDAVSRLERLVDEGT